jgi:hypothetical protein
VLKIRHYAKPQTVSCNASVENEEKKGKRYSEN